jgi:hypothetical protein
MGTVSSYRITGMVRGEDYISLCGKDLAGPAAIAEDLVDGKPVIAFADEHGLRPVDVGRMLGRGILEVADSRISVCHGLSLEDAVAASRAIDRCQRKRLDWDKIKVTIDGEVMSFGDISVWPDLSNSGCQTVQVSPSKQPVFKVG